MDNNTSPLRGLSHSSRTNLSMGRISNHDATLLLLHSMGGKATSRALKAALNEWRPGLAFTYLFNTCPSGGYGFVGKNFYSATNRVYHYPNGETWGREGCETDRRTYWYRSARGCYTLTAEGLRRLTELGFTSAKSNQVRIY